MSHSDVHILDMLSRLTVLLGCMLGVLTACLMVTLAGCLVCPWCPAHRQRRRTIKHKSESYETLFLITDQFYQVQCGTDSLTLTRGVATPLQALASQASPCHPSVTCHARLT